MKSSLGHRCQPGVFTTLYSKVSRSYVVKGERSAITKQTKVGEWSKRCNRKGESKKTNETAFVKWCTPGEKCFLHHYF